MKKRRRLAKAPLRKQLVTAYAFHDTSGASFTQALLSLAQGGFYSGLECGQAKSQGLITRYIFCASQLAQRWPIVKVTLHERRNAWE